MALNDNVYIVLATRNGAGYIAAQIDSLLAQTYSDWVLLVLDDASEDATSEIVEKYARCERRIRRIDDLSDQPQGPLLTFGYLLEAAHHEGAQYVFCADQDDIWKPEKLAIMLAVIKQNESEGQMPCLVHHDLEVVANDLTMIHPSFWKYMAIHPGTEHDAQRLLSRNEVTGCALACNRSLLEVALPVPTEAVMHDWWLALVAGVCGRLRSIEQPLVEYRQHDDNAIGAKNFRSGLKPIQNWLSIWRSGNLELKASVGQSAALARRLSSSAHPDDEIVASAEAFASLGQGNRVQRLKKLKVARTWRRQFFLDFALVLRALLAKLD